MRCGPERVAGDAQIPRLYTYVEIAAGTGLPVAKLRVWVHRGKLPAPDFIVGQSPAWLPASIEPWIAAQAPAAGEK